MGAERLDVYHDVVDFGDGVTDALLQPVGEGMGLGEGHVAVGFDVEGNHVFAADAAGTHAVGIADAFDFGCGVEDFLVDGGVLHAIHKLDVGVHEYLDG